MAQLTTPHGEPEHWFPTDLPSHIIERNKGRLNVLKLAYLGLATTANEHAACLLRILGDILSDLDRLQYSLRLASLQGEAICDVITAMLQALDEEE